MKWFTCIKKIHPTFIEKQVIVGRVAMNFVHIEDVKYDIQQLHLTHKKSKAPNIYKDIKRNRYYLYDIYGINTYYTSYLFDITDVYDWEQIIKANIFSEDYIIKHVQHIKLIIETKKFYPGSPEYDSVYSIK